MPTPIAGTPSARLWTPQGFQVDGWRRAENLEAADTGSGGLILPLQAFLDLSRDECRAADRKLGVELQPGEDLQEIVERLDLLALVALAFPAFNDGRSYSKAELLRRRYDFSGALRATGQILVDQLPLMLRVGFNEFEIVNPVLLQRLEAGQVGGISLYYQPGMSSERSDGSYSWRRRAS